MNTTYSQAIIKDIITDLDPQTKVDTLNILVDLMNLVKDARNLTDQDINDMAADLLKYYGMPNGNMDAGTTGPSL